MITSDERTHKFTPSVRSLCRVRLQDFEPVGERWTQHRSIRYPSGNRVWRYVRKARVIEDDYTHHVWPWGKKNFRQEGVGKCQWKDVSIPDGVQERRIGVGFAVRIIFDVEVYEENEIVLALGDREKR